MLRNSPFNRRLRVTNRLTAKDQQRERERERERDKKREREREREGQRERERERETGGWLGGLGINVYISFQRSVVEAQIVGSLVPVHPKFEGLRKSSNN